MRSEKEEERSRTFDVLHVGDRSPLQAVVIMLILATPVDGSGSAPLENL